MLSIPVTAQVIHQTKPIVCAYRYKGLCWQHAKSEAAISESRHIIRDRCIGDIFSTRVEHFAEVVRGVDRQLAGLGAEACSALELADKDSWGLQATQSSMRRLVPHDKLVTVRQSTDWLLD